MVANAWKSISFQLIGLLWLILLIPHLSPTSLKTKFGLMMSKSMVSQILGPCSVLSRHFCSDIFRFSLKYPQGSSVSFSGRFLVEQKAKYGFMTSFRKPLPSFRILDEETIDFRSFDSRFGRFEWSNYLFASSLDGFMLNNSETWSNYSSRYDKSFAPSLVSNRSPVLEQSLPESRLLSASGNQRYFRPHLDTLPFKSSRFYRSRAQRFLPLVPRLFPKVSSPFKVWNRVSTLSEQFLLRPADRQIYGILASLTHPSVSRSRVTFLPFGPETQVTISGSFSAFRLSDLLDTLLDQNVSGEPDTATRRIKGPQCLAPQTDLWHLPDNFADSLDRRAAQAGGHPPVQATAPELKCLGATGFSQIQGKSVKTLMNSSPSIDLSVFPLRYSLDKLDKFLDPLDRRAAQAGGHPPVQATAPELKCLGATGFSQIQGESSKSLMNNSPSIDSSVFPLRYTLGPKLKLKTLPKTWSVKPRMIKVESLRRHSTSGKGGAGMHSLCLRDSRSSSLPSTQSGLAWRLLPARPIPQSLRHPVSLTACVSRPVPASFCSPITKLCVRQFPP